MPAGLSGNAGIHIGTVANAYAAPMGDATHFLVVPTTGSSGSGILDLGGGYDNISFYWGSIDTYNSVEFFTGVGGTGTSLGVISGGSIPGATGNGAQGTVANNRRVFFDFGTDLAQSVRFTSTNIAFELDDIGTVAVPEPAVWGTMLFGFGLVGATMRRRRLTSVTA
ncbi:PEPxxWA-CTERM sorting domain-containing protein [Sphingosinicellaceae bacterium]|nr:PEPxxWA-CTERM sorting domain-containing protein [Sphingosinicellaceae bacterium]